MLPEIWGKCAWKFLHMVTMDYPENPTNEDKQNYYEFLNSLQNVLPCGKCRNNMKQHLKKNPLTLDALSNRQKLIQWGIDLHNIVNHHTGKRMLTYNEAINEINKWTLDKSTLPQPKKTTNIFYYLIVIIAIVIVCYLVYYYAMRNK